MNSSFYLESRSAGVEYKINFKRACYHIPIKLNLHINNSKRVQLLFYRSSDCSDCHIHTLTSICEELLQAINALIIQYLCVIIYSSRLILSSKRKKKLEEKLLRPFHNFPVLKRYNFHSTCTSFSTLKFTFGNCDTTISSFRFFTRFFYYL